MYLSSLTLSNVRQFDQRTFHFHPGFNLLVGENGAGKTTILRSLVAALGGNAQQSARRTRIGDEDIRIHTNHAEIEAAVQLSNGSNKIFRFGKTLWARANTSRSREERPLVLSYASNEATCSAMRVRQAKRIRGTDGTDLRSSEEYLYQSEREFARRREVSTGIHFGDSYPVREFLGMVLSTFSSDFQDFYWRFEPYDCLLKHSNAENEGPVLAPELEAMARSAALRFFQEDRSRRRNPYDWPDQAKVVLNPGGSKNKSDTKYLPDPREVWKQMRLPDDARKTLLEYSLEVKLTPRIMIQREIGPLTLSQLSDGEQRLFSLFVDIARQLSIQSSHNKIGEGEAVVLVDEIDVHLHPKWQRKIVPALEELFPNCQFIATTHSPFVIQAVQRTKIISIDPKFPFPSLDGGNSIEDIVEDIQGVNLPQRSLRAEKLSEAAKVYFTLLEQMASEDQTVSAVLLTDAERNYREASEPFTSDPAVHALLKVQLLGGGKP